MNHDPGGWEILFGSIRGQNRNQLKQPEQGTPSNSKEWNFPQELSNVDSAVAVSLQGPGQLESP